MVRDMHQETSVFIIYINLSLFYISLVGKDSGNMIKYQTIYGTKIWGIECPMEVLNDNHLTWAFKPNQFLGCTRFYVPDPLKVKFIIQTPW